MYKNCSLCRKKNRLNKNKQYKECGCCNEYICDSCYVDYDLCINCLAAYGAEPKKEYLYTSPQEYNAQFIFGAVQYNVSFTISEILKYTP